MEKIEKCTSYTEVNLMNHNYCLLFSKTARHVLTKLKFKTAALGSNEHSILVQTKDLFEIKKNLVDKYYLLDDTYTEINDFDIKEIFTKEGIEKDRE